MIRVQLTCPAGTAKLAVMHGLQRNQGKRSGWRAVRVGLVVCGAAMGLSACVSVNAPDKPIVIELNINIKQEVVYRLAADAGNTIDKNPEIF